MAKNELTQPEMRTDRTQPVFDQASKVFRSEFPVGAADGYRWEYVGASRLTDVARTRAQEENAGVLPFTLGIPENVQFAHIDKTFARGGSDDVRKRILMPLSTAQRVWMLDTGKVENRETSSDLQTEMFLESARAMLEENQEYRVEGANQDSFSYFFDVYFAGLVKKCRDAGLENEAENTINNIVESLQGSTPEQFGVAYSGLRATVLFNGQPFFTVNDAADSIVQKLISNQIEQKFLKRMDQKHIWFKPNVRVSGFYIPEYKEDDLLMASCREFGLGTDSKKFIEAYLNGELGRSFYAKVHKPYFDATAAEREEREANFFEELQDDDRAELAGLMKNAMLGGVGDEAQPDYSSFGFEDESGGENIDDSLGDFDEYEIDGTVRPKAKKKKEERPLED